MTTIDKRRLALNQANQVRLARAELGHRIRRGEVTAAEVILNPPPEARTWQIGQMLMRQQRWGEVRMQKLLGKHHIGETKTLGQLTNRQRLLLANALELYEL